MTALETINLPGVPFPHSAEKSACLGARNRPASKLPHCSKCGVPIQIGSTTCNMHAANRVAMRVCADCGVPIISGKRCAAHAKLHTDRAYWPSNSVRGVKCTEPGWLEEIFAVDLSHGMTVSEISKHRGIPTAMVGETLRNLHQWLLKQPINTVNTFAALALSRAVENYDCRVA